MDGFLIGLVREGLHEARGTQDGNSTHNTQPRVQGFSRKRLPTRNTDLHQKRNCMLPGKPFLEGNESSGSFVAEARDAQRCCGHSLLACPEEFLREIFGQHVPGNRIDGRFTNFHRKTGFGDYTHTLSGDHANARSQASAEKGRVSFPPFRMSCPTGGDAMDERSKLRLVSHIRVISAILDHPGTCTGAVRLC